jgi:hypothetical protein
MANRKSSTHFNSNQSPDTTCGLGMMEKHWKAEDGQIEEGGAA